MKAMKELVREHGQRDRPGDHPTARRRYFQESLQLDAARSLAAALREIGVDLPRFSWIHQEPEEQPHA